MTAPYATLTVLDGGLGLTSPNGRPQCKVGASSSGTVNTVYAIGSQDEAVSTFGSGPLVEALCDLLARAGGPVYGVRVTSTAGSSSAITQTGTGTSVPTVTTDTPVDDLNVVVVTTKAAANLAAGARVKFSIDGGDTYSDEYAVPSSGIITLAGTGVTLTFGAGSFVAGDTFSFTSAAPSYTSTNAGLAVAAALAYTTRFDLIHMVGVPATGASGHEMDAALAIFTMLDTKLVAAESAYNFTRAIMELNDVSDTLINTYFASQVSLRVNVCGGFCDITSPITLSQMKRPIAWAVAARAAKYAISIDPAQVDLGPLPGVTHIYRDERLTPNLDPINITTLTTIIGKDGYFVTLTHLKAGPGSDFQLMANGRVMDVASHVTRQQLVLFLNKRVRVKKSDGTILEQDALAIEGQIVGALNQALVNPGDATQAICTVNRTVNLLSTRELKVKTRVVPVGYANFITGDIAFLNPGLIAQ